MIVASMGWSGGRQPAHGGEMLLTSCLSWGQSGWLPTAHSRYTAVISELGRKAANTLARNTGRSGSSPRWHPRYPLCVCPSVLHHPSFPASEYLQATEGSTVHGKEWELDVWWPAGCQLMVMGEEIEEFGASARSQTPLSGGRQG